MIPLNQPVVLFAIGNGSANEFAITFPTFVATDITAEITDASGLVTPLVLGVDFSLSNIGVRNQNAKLTLIDTGDYGAGPVPDPLPESQIWLDTSKLALTYTLWIKFSINAFQPSKLLDTRFLPQTIETVLDRLTMHLLAVKGVASLALGLSQGGAGVDPNLPPLTGQGGNVLAVKFDESGFEYVLPGGIPLGGAADAVLAKVSGTDGDVAWDDLALSGFSARFGAAWTSNGIRDTLNKILDFSYLAPLISLSCSPGQSVREKGTSVAAVTMTATTTKRSDAITAVTHFRNGVLVDTEGAPSPTGGAETFTESTPFTDTMSFFSRVFDGTTTVTSNTVTYSYAYPYYEGKGAAGLNAAGIVASLTKVVRSSTANVAVTASPSSEHFYFCYPAAYAVLTSILDPNGFETISAYTYRTVTITGLDASAQSYRVYELTLPTTQTAFTNTFKR